MLVDPSLWSKLKYLQWLDGLDGYEDILVTVTMNCNNFNDPFHVAPSTGQHLSVFNTLVCDQMPEKLDISASAVLCA